MMLTGKSIQSKQRFSYDVVFKNPVKNPFIFEFSVKIFKIARHYSERDV